MVGGRGRSRGTDNHRYGFWEWRWRGSLLGACSSVGTHRECKQHEETNDPRTKRADSPIRVPRMARGATGDSALKVREYSWVRFGTVPTPFGGWNPRTTPTARFRTGRRPCPRHCHAEGGWGTWGCSVCGPLRAAWPRACPRTSQTLRGCVGTHRTRPRTSAPGRAVERACPVSLVRAYKALSVRSQVKRTWKETKMQPPVR